MELPVLKESFLEESDIALVVVEQLTMMDSSNLESFHESGETICTANNVTRLGDLLDFGQLFKAFGNN